jgi:hypothetical protein
MHRASQSLAVKAFESVKTLLCQLIPGLHALSPISYEGCPMKVGVIGLDAMGSVMASNLPCLFQPV